MKAESGNCHIFPIVTTALVTIITERSNRQNRNCYVCFMRRTLPNLPCDLSKRVNSVGHTDESWFMSERFYIFVLRRMSFHICDSINSHIWNDRLTYVSWSNHICGTTNPEWTDKNILNTTILIKYDVYKTPSPWEEEPDRFHAWAVSKGVTTYDQLKNDLEHASSATPGDVSLIMDGIVSQIKKLSRLFIESLLRLFLSEFAGFVSKV